MAEGNYSTVRYGTAWNGMEQYGTSTVSRSTDQLID